jgi:hypothetical protein
VFFTEEKSVIIEGIVGCRWGFHSQEENEMRLMVTGHASNGSEVYGEIPDIQDYNLDKSMAAASVLDDVAGLITIAKQRGGPAKMILALEPEQGSAVVGVIHEIEQYELTKSRALRRAEGLD